MGGESRQKVELGELIEQLLKDVRAIDGNAELSRGDKTKRLTRLAARLKNTLFEDRRRKEEDKLAASSYRRYLTTIRKAVTAQNWRHHSLEEAIGRMAKRHPRWAEQLEAMGAHAQISEVRLAHRDLLAEVRRAGDSDAYDDIRAMKLDHEIMRHLTLPAATKADLADEHHPDDLHDLGRRHPQTVAELHGCRGFGEHGVDLRSAAMDDDGTDTHRRHEDDVVGKCLLQARVNHGIATVLHDDGPALEPSDPR